MPKWPGMRARITPESVPRCFRNMRPHHSGIPAQVPPESAPGSGRNTHYVHAGCLHHPSERCRVQRIPVEDQIPLPSQRSVLNVQQISCHLLRPPPPLDLGRSQRSPPPGSRCRSRRARGTGQVQTGSSPRRGEKVHPHDALDRAASDRVAEVLQCAFHPRVFPAVRRCAQGT